VKRAGLIGLLLVGACAGILGLRAPGPHPFEHRAHTRAGLSCLSCHTGVDKAGDHDPLHLPADESCVSCHKQPHDPRSCTGCHGGPLLAQGAADARAHLRYSHEQHVPVAKFNCVRCHSDVARDGEFLRPRMATCFGCHEHEDEFAQRTCDRCHVDLAEEDVVPQSHLVHDGDWLREHGTRAGGERDLCETCHSQRFCGGCHGVNVPALPARVAFDAPDTASVHRAGFRARHADEARGAPGLCTSCHRDSFCVGCHEDKRVAGPEAATPHPPGWVSLRGEDNLHGRAARRNPLECASCHGGAGEALCVGCHKVGGVGGNPHPAGWSSRQPMSALPCRLCHPVPP
jgi:Cytochrome c7 and related cytochrome c